MSGMAISNLPAHQAAGPPGAGPPKVGSAGSVLSIGSFASLGSMLSAGSIASLGSALSGFSQWSWLSWRGQRYQLPAGRSRPGNGAAAPAT